MRVFFPNWRGAAACMDTELKGAGHACEFAVHVCCIITINCNQE